MITKNKYKIDSETGCWSWLLSKSKKGYARTQLRRGGNVINAHRVMWIETYGAIPNGLWVLHKCDNRACVNPSHLFLGTNLDNVRDREAKGRGNHHKKAGELCVTSKFTNEEVKNIRMLKAKYSLGQLARMFNVGKTTIAYIVSGKTYRYA